MYVKYIHECFPLRSLTFRSVEVPIQQLVINPFYANDPRYGLESRIQSRQSQTIADPELDSA
jgi:hypothetical protein